MQSVRRYPNDEFRLNNGSGHIQHNATACVSTHFRLELPALERDVDELEGSETVDTEPSGSKGNSLLFLVVFDIVHVLRGPYLSLGYPVRY